jgi:hypothetical protein
VICHDVLPIVCLSLHPSIPFWFENHKNGLILKLYIAKSKNCALWSKPYFEKKETFQSIWTMEAEVNAEKPQFWHLSIMGHKCGIIKGIKIKFITETWHVYCGW